MGQDPGGVMITAKLIGNFVVSITGLDMEAAGKAEWRAALTEYGNGLQERIAESFAGERVAGSSQLKTNTPEYNRRKLAEGYDSRRGHRTNFLQGALDGAPLFQVSAVTVNGRGFGSARITFQESKLHSRVPYAEYYEESKVRRAGILALAKSWLADGVIGLRAVEAKLLLKQKRKSERSRTRNTRLSPTGTTGRIANIVKFRRK